MKINLFSKQNMFYGSSILHNFSFSSFQDQKFILKQVIWTFFSICSIPVFIQVNSICLVSLESEALMAIKRV